MSMCTARESLLLRHTQTDRAVGIGFYDTKKTILLKNKVLAVIFSCPQVSSASHPTLLDLRVSITYHGLTKLRNFGKGSNSDFHSLHEELSSLMQFARPVVHQPRYYWLEDKLGLSLPMMGYVCKF